MVSHSTPRELARVVTSHVGSGPTPGCRHPVRIASTVSESLPHGDRRADKVSLVLVLKRMENKAQRRAIYLGTLRLHPRLWLSGN